MIFWIATDQSKVTKSRCTTRLNLESFDMDKVLARSSHLTGSEGSEYDLTIADGEQPSLPNQQENLATKLGLHPRLMDITSDLFTDEDLVSTVPQVSSQATTTMTVDETLKQSEGLSRREMNRAKRKVSDY